MSPVTKYLFACQESERLGTVWVHGCSQRVDNNNHWHIVRCPRIPQSAGAVLDNHVVDATHHPNIPPEYGFFSHDWQYQASFFPMIHDGKPGFEWWVVEPSWEDKPVPSDVKGHLTNILEDSAQLMPRFLEATNFDSQVYHWGIYNRPSMKKWSKGRVVCVGDAVHPVSPCAAYGMGMAIEDGCYLAKYLDGADLRVKAVVNAGFELHEQKRVDYVNHNMKFARFLGRLFHSLPWPLAWVRDMIFDYTPFLSYFLSDGYLR